MAARCRLPLPLLAPVAVLLLAAWAAADYRQSYLDGLKALRRGEWPAAAAHLEAAARVRPTEQARARLVGVIPEPYLPHHYLGVVYYHLRRCADAAERWDLSAAQGAVESLPEIQRQALGYQRDCAALAAAREALRAAEEAADRLAEAAAATTEVWGADPDLEHRRREALGSLAAARDRLGDGEGSWSFGAVREAAELARTTGEELAALAAELGRRQRTAERQALAATLAKRAAEAGELLAAPRRAPPPPSAVRAAARLTSLLARAAESGEDTPADDLEALVRELSEAVAAGRAAFAPPTAGGDVGGSPPATGAAASPTADAADPGAVPPVANLADATPAAAAEPPPEELVAAIQAYFDGDYSRALQALGRPDLESHPRARFFTLLFRSAAGYALYLEGGERDAALLAAAVADLRAGRRENPSFAPHPDSFSPRFIAFFRDHP